MKTVRVLQERINLKPINSIIYIEEIGQAKRWFLLFQFCESFMNVKAFRLYCLLSSEFPFYFTRRRRCRKNGSLSSTKPS